METMYAGRVNSPATTLDGAINDSVQTIDVIDGSVLPTAPNLAVIGTGEDAETILYGVKIANQLTSVTRGFQGVAKAWDSGTAIARMFTEYDYAKLKQNIETLDTEKGEVNTASNVGEQVEIYKQKTGVDLEFRTLKALSDKIIVDNAPSTIVVGAEAIDRNTSREGNFTWINMKNPALASGVIVKVEIWANESNMSGCKVGTFYGSGTVFSCRDYETVDNGNGAGVVLYGSKQTFVVSLNVEIGDIIGIYFVNGRLEQTDTGEVGVGYAGGDQMPSTNVAYNMGPFADDAVSVYGTSDVTPLNYIYFDIDPTKIIEPIPSTLSLLSATTVSFGADADTTLYTVPAGKRCVLHSAIVVAAGDAGATTTVSIGKDTAETDFVPANTLSNLDAQHDTVILMPIPNTTPLTIKSYAAATVIQARVANQSGVAGNTIYLFGILY